MNKSPIVNEVVEKTRELLCSHQSNDGQVHLFYERLYTGEFVKLAREIIRNLNAKARRFSERNGEFLFEGSGRYVMITYRYIMTDNPYRFEIRLCNDLLEFGEDCDDIGVLHNLFK